MYSNQTTAYPTAPPAPVPSASFTHASSTARRITVVLVDHHPVVQLGVRHFLGESPQLNVEGGAHSGAEGVDLVRRLRPDVALVQPHLPDVLLEDFVEHCRASSPNTRLIVFAPHISPTIREQVAALGVEGLVSQDGSAAHVIDVVLRVAGGEAVDAPPSDDLLRSVADKLHCAPLTAWEHEILRHAARGASNSEIAAEIFLAPTTVKSYLQSALGKLGARNRAEAVFMLGELGLL